MLQKNWEFSLGAHSRVSDILAFWPKKWTFLARKNLNRSNLRENGYFWPKSQKVQNTRMGVITVITTSPHLSKCSLGCCWIVSREVLGIVPLKVQSFRLWWCPSPVIYNVSMPSSLGQAHVCQSFHLEHLIEPSI